MLVQTSRFTLVDERYGRDVYSLTKQRLARGMHILALKIRHSATLPPLANLDLRSDRYQEGS